ncbi:MAG: tyrosine-type recombinase/integrase [Proteobacteria bacterium]|nr:tyrosine-type recombinase/integrase [Pseudomonadota bacterium]
MRTYESTISNLRSTFGDRDLLALTPDDILSFLTAITEGRKQLTKRTRYSHLKTFFNFIKNNVDQDFQNPCDTPMMRKLFRGGGAVHWRILEKELVDEIIFRTTKPRNRLILELMARGGMRISEVLKLTPIDIDDRKLILRDPKSGRQQEVVYIPQKIADRLKGYVRDKEIEPHQRIFPITYAAARMIAKKAGMMVDICLRPHDLRRHAATYASRSGVPIEIVSKVILRHANLSTTQRYLGKVSDSEAMRWIENLYG